MMKVLFGIGGLSLAATGLIYMSHRNTCKKLKEKLNRKWNYPIPKILGYDNKSKIEDFRTYLDSSERNSDYILPLKRYYGEDYFSLDDFTGKHEFTLWERIMNSIGFHVETSQFCYNIDYIPAYHLDDMIEYYRNRLSENSCHFLWARHFFRNDDVNLFRYIVHNRVLPGENIYSNLFNASPKFDEFLTSKASIFEKSDNFSEQEKRDLAKRAYKLLHEKFYYRDEKSSNKLGNNFEVVKYSDEREDFGRDLYYINNLGEEKLKLLIRRYDSDMSKLFLHKDDVKDKIMNFLGKDNFAKDSSYFKSISEIAMTTQSEEKLRLIAQTFYMFSQNYRERFPVKKYLPVKDEPSNQSRNFITSPSERLDHR